MTFRVAGALLLVVSALLLSFWLRPTERLSDSTLILETAVPQRFGDWSIDPSVVPIAPTPDVQVQLDAIYDQLVSRTYVNGRGKRVMLSIAYGGDQTDAFRAHRQEVCYRAQGFVVRHLGHENVKLLGRAVPVVRLHATHGLRSEPVTYWMTMGERIVWLRRERMAAQIAYGLRGKIVDGMLVRVSSLDTDLSAAFELQRDFLNVMLESVDVKQQSRFVGPASASATGSLSSSGT